MHGTPRLIYAPYPFLILQTTRSVNFVHEVESHVPDHLLGSGPAGGSRSGLPRLLRSPVSRGRTLVIDTIGLNDKTWLDYSGLPHGEKLRVQERYTLTDPQTIKGSVTITDPDFYTAPWTTGFTLKRQSGMDIKENVCTDTHRM